MVEQERLELVSAVTEENHDELDDLAESLDNVDTALRDAGSDSSDEVKINVDVDGLGSALTQLEALDERLESIDDADVSIDGPNMGGGDMAMATSGGRPSFPSNYEPDNEEDVLPRGSASLRAYRDHNRELAAVDELNVDEVRLTTSENPKTFFDAPFGQGTGTADDARTRELINLLEGEDEQFSPFDVGQRDGSDTIQMERNTGLAAEGLGGELGAELIEAQREAMEMRDDETLLESLDGAEKEFKDIRFTMGQFHDIIAALIPLAGVFIGAMPAAITGIVALGGAALAAAGALAGIGALGAMGLSLQQSGELSFDPLNEMLVDIRDSFVDAFAPLSMTFAPLIRDAATELETMMGPLSTAASGLQMFTDEFQALTQLAGDALPSMVSLSLRFADAVMPVLAGIGQFLVQKDIFGFMANQLATALPFLTLLGESFVQLLPAIVRVSQGLLATASVLLSLAGSVGWLINQFGMLGPIIGTLIGAYLTLVTASTLYTIVTWSAIRAIGRFALALAVKAVPAIKGAISSLAAYTGMSYAAATATAVLLSVVTLGAAAIGVMSAGWLELSSNIGSATKNLRQFARTSNGIGSTNLGVSGSGFGSGSRSGFYRDNSTTVIQAGDRDSAARQQYSSEYERRQHVDSVFGG